MRNEKKMPSIDIEDETEERNHDFNPLSVKTYMQNWIASWTMNGIL